MNVEENEDPEKRKYRYKASAFLLGIGGELLCNFSLKDSFVNLSMIFRHFSNCWIFKNNFNGSKERSEFFQQRRYWVY